MSTSTADVAGPTSSADHAEDHHGPTDKQFFMIFWVLVVLTALEVSTEWWDEWFGESSRKIAVPLLIFNTFSVVSYTSIPSLAAAAAGMRCVDVHTLTS